MNFFSEFASMVSGTDSTPKHLNIENLLDKKHGLTEKEKTFIFEHLSTGD